KRRKNERETDAIAKRDGEREADPHHAEGDVDRVGARHRQVMRGDGGAHRGDRHGDGDRAGDERAWRRTAKDEITHVRGEVDHAEEDRSEKEERDGEADREREEEEDLDRREARDSRVAPPDDAREPRAPRREAKRGAASGIERENGDLESVQTVTPCEDGA